MVAEQLQIIIGLDVRAKFISNYESQSIDSPIGNGLLLDYDSVGVCEAISEKADEANNKQNTSCRTSKHGSFNGPPGEEPQYCRDGSTQHRERDNEVRPRRVQVGRPKPERSSRGEQDSCVPEILE